MEWRTERGMGHRARYCAQVVEKVEKALAKVEISDNMRDGLKLVAGVIVNEVLELIMKQVQEVREKMDRVEMTGRGYISERTEAQASLIPEWGFEFSPSPKLQQLDGHSECHVASSERPQQQPDKKHFFSRLFRGTSSQRHDLREGSNRRHAQNAFVRKSCLRNIVIDSENEDEIWQETKHSSDPELCICRADYCQQDEVCNDSSNAPKRNTYDHYPEQRSPRDVGDPIKDIDETQNRDRLPALKTYNRSRNSAPYGWRDDFSGGDGSGHPSVGAGGGGYSGGGFDGVDVVRSIPTTSTPLRPNLTRGDQIIPDGRVLEGMRFQRRTKTTSQLPSYHALQHNRTSMEFQTPQMMRLVLLCPAEIARFRSASDSKMSYGSCSPQLVSNALSANITWASPIFFPGQPNPRVAKRLQTKLAVEAQKQFRELASKYQSYKDVVSNGLRGVGVLWCSPSMMHLRNMRFGLGPVAQFVVSLDENTEMALHVSGVRRIFLHDDWHERFCQLLPAAYEENDNKNNINNNNNNNNDFIKSMLRPRRDVAGGSQVDNDGNVSQWCCAVLQVDPRYKLLRRYESGAGNGLCLNDSSRVNPTTGSVSRKETDYSPGSEYTMFQPTHRSATTGSFGSSDIRSAEQQAESLKSPSSVVKIEVQCQNATDFTTPRYPQFDFVRGRISSRDGPVPCSPPRRRSRSCLVEDSNESCWDYVPFFFPNYAQRESFVEFQKLLQKFWGLPLSEIVFGPPTTTSHL